MNRVCLRYKLFLLNNIFLLYMINLWDNTKIEFGVSSLWHTFNLFENVQFDNESAVKYFSIKN